MMTSCHICPVCGVALSPLTGDLRQPPLYRCNDCQVNYRFIGILVPERGADAIPAPGSLTESKLPEPGPKKFDPNQYK